MKRFILILVMLVIGTASYAQQRLRLTDDELDLVVLSMNLEGPAMTSLEMKQELHLSEEQYAEVAKLNAARFAELEQAEASSSNNPTQKTKQFRNINLKNDRSLQAVLTESQLRQFREMEGRYNMQFITEHESE